MRPTLRRIIIAIAAFTVLNFAGDALLKYGLHRFYGLDRHPHILLTGHSQLAQGSDKKGLEDSLGRNIAKFCLSGAGVEERDVLLHYVLDSEAGDSVNTVVYAVDPWLFNNRRLTKNMHRMFLPLTGAPAADSLLATKLSAGRRLLYKTVPLARYNDEQISYALRGMAGNWNNIHHNRVDTAVARRYVGSGNYRYIAPDSVRIVTFRNTLKMLRQRGIRILLVGMPGLYVYNEAQPEAYARVDSLYRAIADADTGIYYFNLDPEFSHRAEMFSDAVHLNAAGQKAVTSRLAQIIKERTEEVCFEGDRETKTHKYQK
ncbi:MAG: hypothetical protein J6J20_10100 [Muribaculaceae bacterium]|nr:hypothetical protein [Muribaculaceae bacterium]